MNEISRTKFYNKHRDTHTHTWGQNKQTWIIYTITNKTSNSLENILSEDLNRYKMESFTNKIVYIILLLNNQGLYLPFQETTGNLVHTINWYKSGKITFLFPHSMQQKKNLLICIKIKANKNGKLTSFRSLMWNKQLI